MPQTITEGGTEQPKKPSQKIIIQVNACPPPIFINTSVFVEPSNRAKSPVCSSPRPASSLSKNTGSSNNNDLLPATSFISTSLDKGVKLRLTEETSKYKPITVYNMFNETVNNKPDALALAFKSKDNPDWNKINYKQYWDICRKAAKSFIKLGLDVNQCVGIIGFNSPEWFFSLLGAIFAGGVGCGMYTTNSADACEYVLKDSQAPIVVVENAYQLNKIISSKDRTKVKKIIQYSGPVQNNHGGLVIDWNTFMELGNDVSDTELEKRVNTLAPNKCATLIYTSGTTGDPKAAMISHDNITFTSRYMPLDLVNMKPFEERLVSYLPLSHIAAQICDVFTSICIGSAVYFAQPDALKGTLNQTLKEVKPTFFFGVPRIWEKMQETIEKVVGGMPKPVQEQMVLLRKNVGDQVKLMFKSNQKGVSTAPILQKLPMLAKLHADLGLDQCRNFYSGAAPISRETLEFFIGLGIPVCEVYGLSETTGPHSNGIVSSNRIGSIGQVGTVNQSKLFNKDQEGGGELCMYGRHIFMGYLNDEKKTKDSIDSDGWFHSGDVAKIDDGFLYITGRIKEILITAGGENVSPVPIEDNLKAALPKLVSNAMLIGDKQKYLTILVTLKVVLNPETTVPTDNLLPETIEYLKSNGSNSTKVSDIIKNKDPAVYKLIEEGIKNVNEKSTSNASKIQKFLVLPNDFSVLTGELGPTLKLRRQIVNKMYANEITNLYNEK